MVARIQVSRNDNAACTFIQAGVWTLYDESNVTCMLLAEVENRNGEQVHR